MLTHRGQTLEEIEKFDDPRSEDEMSEDEDRLGRLDKKFVADAHFGGGVLSRPDSTASRKDVIEQLIAESKKRKAERQKTKEETVDLTEKLDSEWRDLLPLVNSSFKKSEDKANGKKEVDDYDIAVREMKFEARGQATDKLKSEETIKEEEQKKIDEFEAERIARMQVPDTSSGFKHKSADDLDDGYFVGEDVVEESEELGENVQEENPEQPMDTLNDGEDDSDSDEESGAEEEEEAEGDELLSDEENVEQEEDDLKEEATGAQSGEESSDDDLMDLKQDESASEDEVETAPVAKKPIVILTTVNTEKLSIESEKTIKLASKQVATTRDKFLSELKVPETYEDFELLLGKHEADYQGKIVEQIIKIKDDKAYLSNLFIFLMQYTDDCMLDCENIVRSFQIFDR